jgi:WD40 repeat protein
MKTFSTMTLFTFFATAALGQSLHQETKLESSVPLDYAIVCEHGAQIVGFSHDGALYAWTLPSSSGRKIAIPDGPAHDITCAGGSTLAVWLGSDKGALILDLNTGKVRSHIEPKDKLEGFGLSPDGSLLVIAPNGGPAQLWDTRTGQRLATGVTSFGASSSATFSPKGDIFLSTDDDTSIRAYDRNGKHLYTADGGLLEPFAAVFTGDGKHFLAAGAGGTISLYDSASGKKLKTSASCGNPIFDLKMSPDGQQVIALELDDFTLKPVAIGLWDMRSDNIHPLDVETTKFIGAGANQSHLLLIKQEDPKTITVYSLQ